MSSARLLAELSFRICLGAKTLIVPWRKVSTLWSHGVPGADCRVAAGEAWSAVEFTISASGSIWRRPR